LEEKMRITFITPQPPEQFGGGGMLIYAHLLALSHLLGSNNLLYFGPESKSVDIASLVKEVYYVPQSSNVEKVKAVMTQRNYTTLGIYYEQHKQEIVKMIKEFSDFVWVEFTKTGHLINDLQNAECYVACYAHNYEHDYYMISERNIYYLFKAAIIENERLRNLFKATSSRNGFHTLNAFGFKACEIVYTQSEKWLDDFIALIYKNADILKDYIEKELPMIKVYTLEGTYLQWMDFSALNMSNEELEKFLHKDCQLFFDEGYIFGSEGNGFERMNIACPTVMMLEGLERLKTELKKRGY